MPAEIYLVKVGMTMTEGSVEKWYANDGDHVSTGDLLYRLETEKVNSVLPFGRNRRIQHTSSSPGCLCSVRHRVPSLVGLNVTVPKHVISDRLVGNGCFQGALPAKTAGSGHERVILPRKPCFPFIWRGFRRRSRVGSREVARWPHIPLPSGGRSDPDTATAVRKGEKPPVKN